MSEGRIKIINNKWFSLIGSKCRSCGKVFFPPKTVCSSCFKRYELEEVTLSKKGKLYTYSVISLGLPSGFDKPYACGYVDLPEGVRLFSILDECEPFDQVLKTGMKMEMVIKKIKHDEEGNIIVGYKFKPI